MKLPSNSDPRWRAYLLNTSARPPLNFLALKIFLGRVTITLGSTPSDEDLRGAIQQFRELLEKNQNLPSVKTDVAALFGSPS